VELLRHLLILLILREELGVMKFWIFPEFEAVNTVTVGVGIGRDVCIVEV
jgi:hypothetical protein